MFLAILLRFYNKFQTLKKKVLMDFKLLQELLTKKLVLNFLAIISGIQCCIKVEIILMFII